MTADLPEPPDAPPPMIEARGLSVHFPVRRRHLLEPRRRLRAVDSVDLSVRAGETLALVGESGCGKTTLARALAGLHRPSAGEVRYRGEGLARAPRSRVRAFRRAVQILFQDPFGSLDPRWTVGRIVAEPLAIHRLGARAERRRRTDELLEAVGLTADDARRHPHEFSGGQRQRIALARALAPGPRLVIADEPVSALDVSIQSQILNLLADLKESFDLSLLFISHDIAVVDFLADRVAVMYLGRIVETGPREMVLRTPGHPYTRALIDAAPALKRERRRAEPSPGGAHAALETPSAIEPPSGCAFHPRCPHARAVCAKVRPVLLPVAVGEMGAQEAACHFSDEVRR
jgi:oligopeptide/dipeptide ABC transporter ATP-binding protein